ncbi:cysteinyl-tRNA synthetase [Devosia subaequoris]|uniref:Cysteine--tRNA ligase n=1 Tax=Devosia subaequoris TaxID=395930 RepID=A0A7W6IL55_9HYPH|nr:cysteine--tRNA ligase [Devosia subaequoris]MBB4050995.1 cysteinyl-tRNA synthetase [Devosia subaequoris]MCP1208337.1 cysteine--tRNA ligase [Devosia subaequoris]
MTPAKPQLSLYNTLTRTKAPFVPMDENNVRLYACGPTVYDFAHIGNGRAAIVFDLLFRLLRYTYGEEHVTYVRNITDVDDKINARALRDHPDLPLNEAIRKVTETTAAQYQKDVAALGCLEPTIQPRATENIVEMQEMIQRLLDKGNAYEADGEVLFAVDSMPDYGQLSGRNLEDNLAGARVAIDTHKRNPADFVLWKLSSEDEPGWDSPWGRGRPGWHIECSAMSERYLGETFDIHGGGLDLIFPHHENEIAQSRCAHGSHAMANVWMHNGFLQVEGQKMSKSLGNFFTIHDLLETEAFGGRKWPGEVLRLAMLMTHYREPIDFTVRRLEEAEALLNGWYRAVGDVTAEGGLLCAGMVDALDDDLNTPAAVQALHELRAEAVKGIAPAMRSLKASAALLGLLTDTATHWFSGEDVEAGAVQTQVTARLAALNAKDFAKADAIRNELAEQGIALMDYKDENGQRQTKWEVKR